MWRRQVGALLLRHRSTPSSTLRHHLPLPVPDQSPPLASNLLLRLFTSQSGEGGDGATKPFIAFVLGGPGSGKGTQCVRIASDFGFAHLSAGDLLRSEISTGSEKGELILNIIKEGKIVPSEITVELIRKAMESSDAKRVLIDGFPRCEENRIAFERITGTEPDLVIFFDCPEDEMVKRLLGRNQGRVDDNIETIKKRLKVFESLNIPVVDYYTSRGKVHKINATGTEEEIFGAVHKLFSSLRALGSVQMVGKVCICSMHGRRLVMMLFLQLQPGDRLSAGYSLSPVFSLFHVGFILDE
ncbi:uMP-CMP kinase 2 isoform X1 [Oryza sativa Japonica Group]|uniref:uMP-CMP kinase 2 isoform X1 n=1 Tax=Oryza sativa subsp. japonica TaxID=39947 RepID=UPI0007754313|nr:UMP-CMP kinase 2 isoform X1 [Oryza sativa Japonica Group]